MKAVWLLLVLFAAACSSSGDSTEQAEATIPEGTCLQLEVVVGEGFRVDGELTPQDQLGATLTAKLESGNRSAVVDVTCGEGVTMESIRELHDIMLAQDLDRIQYFREPEPPIQLVIPNAEMDALLSTLDEDAICVVAIAPDGHATLEGDPFDQDAVVATLEANPEIIFVVAASDDVMYRDFARVLGDVTGAGAQRVSVQLIPS